MRPVRIYFVQIRSNVVLASRWLRKNASSRTNSSFPTEHTAFRDTDFSALVRSETCNSFYGKRVFWSFRRITSWPTTAHARVPYKAYRAPAWCLIYSVCVWIHAQVYVPLWFFSSPSFASPERPVVSLCALAFFSKRVDCRWTIGRRAALRPSSDGHKRTAPRLSSSSSLCVRRRES